MKRAGPLWGILLVPPAVASWTRAQSPVLYRNARSQEVGPEQAERDIEACRTLVESCVEGTASKNIGKGAAIGAGAIVGSPGTGAALGAATGGTAGGASEAGKQTEPSPVYKEFVNRCLSEWGYEVLGWQ
jgi:outer membrane lipoprotein SlyB